MNKEIVIEIQDYLIEKGDNKIYPDNLIAFAEFVEKDRAKQCITQGVMPSYSQEELMTFITKLRKTQHQITDLEHKCLDFDFKLEAEEAELISKIIAEMKIENKDKMASKFTLIAGNRKFELNGHQSPRGLRNKDKRPSIVELDIKERFDLVGLHKHIQYLQTLSAAMEN